MIKIRFLAFVFQLAPGQHPQAISRIVRPRRSPVKSLLNDGAAQVDYHQNQIRRLHVHFDGATQVVHRRDFDRALRHARMQFLPSRAPSNRFNVVLVNLVARR